MDMKAFRPCVDGFMPIVDYTGRVYRKTAWQLFRLRWHTDMVWNWMSI